MGMRDALRAMANPQQQQIEHRAWCERNRWCTTHDRAIGQCPKVAVTEWTFEGRRTVYVDCEG